MLFLRKPRDRCGHGESQQVQERSQTETVSSHGTRTVTTDSQQESKKSQLYSRDAATKSVWDGDSFTVERSTDHPIAVLVADKVKLQHHDLVYMHAAGPPVRVKSIF